MRAARVAAALGTSPGHVVFTGGGSEADNLAVLGRLVGGGRAVSTPLEHPAVARTLAAAADEVALVPVDAHGVVDLAALDELRTSG